MLSPYEQLKHCEPVKYGWGIDGGEITPKLGLKRKVNKEKGLELLHKMHTIED